MDETDQRAYIFGTIFTLSNRLQLLGDRIDERLTVKQWLFLAGVLQCRRASTLSEIAAHIGTSRQNVKKTAAILQKQGFIHLERDPRDARALQISLTEACLTHLKQRGEMERCFIEALFAGFDPGEVMAFSGMMKRLEKNADEMGRQA